MSKRKTVLIVDDSTALVDALAAALEDAGYAVGSARDGEEVFRKMPALEPDLMLLDVYMPKLDGAEVCRLVKSHPHWKKTHLVLMSARIAEHELEPYRRMGADEILRKPVAPSAVVELVRRAIGPPA
jgi:twitching motility two-component system response regulator PilG